LIVLASIPIAMFAAADARATLPRPAEILAQVRRVADWQLAHRDRLDAIFAGRPSAREPRDWQQATFWVAIAELADRDSRYRAPLLDLGRAQRWRLGDRPFHADDQLIGQVWLWAARHGVGDQALAPMRAYFDHVLADPPRGGLTFVPNASGTGDPACTTRWCWCDALFMAPPTLLKLAKATGDQRYARFAHDEFAATKALLFDPGEHLFFRDSRFFDRRDDAGRKLFWSRGNGWVMAGLVRIIETLDPKDPARAGYVALFREMATRLLSLQRSNGYWAPSLLADGADVPPETSGTGFFVYAFARGISLGVLDRRTYEPAVLKGWAALGRAVQPDGMIGWVQQVSDRPDMVARADTQFYGAGAFVLAGTAVYDLSLRPHAR
jgi:unsaturated rhamnogalacturonyl hydrolase